MSAPAAAGLLSVEAARDAVLAVAEPVGAERIGVADALGRITAETVVAIVSLPPWPNSAMDGYAIRAADTTGATESTPVELRVIGDIAAGAAPHVVVSAGTAARIATGARVPEGADAVVPVEATTPLDAAGRLGPRGRDATGPVPVACLVHEPVAIGGSVRTAGSDLKAGRAPLSSGDGDHGRGRRTPGGRRGREPSRSIGTRGSRSSPRATKSARPASRSARPGSPTRTARACAPW